MGGVQQQMRSNKQASPDLNVSVIRNHEPAEHDLTENST